MGGRPGPDPREAASALNLGHRTPLPPCRMQKGRRRKVQVVDGHASVQFHRHPKRIELRHLGTAGSQGKEGVRLLSPNESKRAMGKEKDEVFIPQSFR